MSKYLSYDIPKQGKASKNKSSVDKENELEKLRKELEEIKETLTIQNRDNLDAMYNIGTDNLDDGLLKFISQTGNSIASLIIKTDENSASIQAFAEWKDGNGKDSLAGFIAEATKDYATSEMLAKYTTTDKVNSLISTATAGVVAEAREGMATVSMLANYTTTDNVNSLINNAKSGIVSEAQKDMATISMLSSYTTTSQVNSLISSASSGIISKAQDGMATTEMISAVTDRYGDITAASIVAAVNDSSSSVKISADKVDISGFVTISDLETPGSVEIYGNNISLNADSDGDSESTIEFVAYSSYRDDDVVMARIITRDNGSSSEDAARRALVVKTNRPYFDTSTREPVAFKVEAMGSISLESSYGKIYMDCYEDIQLHAPTGVVRISPGYFGGDISLNSGEYTFCADGIYYGKTLILEV